MSDSNAGPGAPQQQQQHEIALQSGTNEVEFLEFSVRDSAGSILDVVDVVVTDIEMPRSR